MLCLKVLLILLKKIVTQVVIVMEQPESSEDEDGEEAQISQDLRGYRLIDVDILKRNILSQLSCTFCHSEVNLSEIERKGLGSKFAFMCQNKNCDRQQAFSSVMPNHSSGKRKCLFCQSTLGFCDEMHQSGSCSALNIWWCNGPSKACV